MVFLLRELEGASTEEVAKILGISPACVRQCLLRARRTLMATRVGLASKAPSDPKDVTDYPSERSQKMSQA